MTQRRLRLNLFCLVTAVIIRTGSGGFGINLSIDNSGVQNDFGSPCPDNFQYHFENNKIIYGDVQINSPGDSIVQLNIELSVGNNVQGFNGEIELAQSKEKTIQDILNHRAINYRVYFPRWFAIAPKVTKILVNGNLICTGPPINIKSVRVLTTINLQHTLRLNVPPSSLSGGRPDERFDATPVVRPNFQIPAIDFNPAPPKDPTRVFPGNPFFSPGTSTPTPTPHVTAPVQFFENDVPTTPIPNTVDRLLELGANTDVCGLSVSTNSLVANGHDVQKGQYPWLVAIFMIKSLGPEFLCGGNLITHRHVVTAAHCMKMANKILHVDKIFLRLGEHNIHQWTQTFGSKAVGAARIVVHPDYKPMSADADVAVLTLSEEVEFTKLIRPICLWNENFSLDRIVGDVGTVVGWGKDESNSLVTSEPKQVRFPVVSQEVCLRSHFTFREITSERTFCAGYKNGSGPCNGDSGGSFAMMRSSRWTLRGIVSMSIAKERSCDFSQYFVFTDITKFMDWIYFNIRN